MTLPDAVRQIHSDEVKQNTRLEIMQLQIYGLAAKSPKPFPTWRALKD